MKFVPLHTSLRGSTPKHIANERIEARSPLHAGLILAKKLLPLDKNDEIGIVVVRMTDNMRFEIHVRKRNVGGGWVYYGQAYKR